MPIHHLKQAYEHIGATWRYKNNPKVHAIHTDGMHSDFYFNARTIASYPRLLETIARELLQLGKFVDKEADWWFIGPERGAVTIAHELARQTGSRCGFTEKIPKGMQFIGFPLPTNAHVYAVDDTMSEGKSTLRNIRAIEQAGGIVFAPIFTIAQRTPLKVLDDRPIITTAMYNEGAVWNPNSPLGCALCHAGSQPLRPKENWHLFRPDLIH